MRSFLCQDGDSEQAWKGAQVTDGFSGYKATFERGVTEAGWVVHARRNFHELWANHGSKLGELALRYFQVLFRIEAEVDSATAEERLRLGSRAVGPEGRVYPSRGTTSCRHQALSLEHTPPC